MSLNPSLNQSLNYDLHCHSTASDGALSPQAMVQHARQHGVDVLALTDHDITAGIAEAQAAATDVGIQLVPGVEISVTWKGATIHVLGLCLDVENSALQDGLASVREFRHWRAEEIGRRLAKHGIENALEGAKSHAGGSIISRTHFAHFLVEQGHAKDFRSVFKRFLVNNKPGYVPGQWASLEDAIGWISAAGGQAVLAHPARYNISASKLRKFLTDFRECGGVGMEVVSGSHGVDECRTMARYADQFGLLASRGSDYHGPAHNHCEPGRIPPLPEQCEPIWETWQ